MKIAVCKQKAGRKDSLITFIKLNIPRVTLSVNQEYRVQSLGPSSTKIPMKKPLLCQRRSLSSWALKKTFVNNKGFICRLYKDNKGQNEICPH